MHLSGVFLYPVKSLRGFAVETANLDSLGLVGDRRFLLVDENNRFLTQRVLPRMTLVVTALDAVHLHLSAEGAGSIRVPLASDPGAPVRGITLWKNEGLLTEDCGDAPATWLSDFLDFKCRLVRIGEKFRRPVGPHDFVHFADGYPLLVISEASLVDLNDRIVAHGEDAIPMNRFRPNLVVSGCAAFAEDTWPRFRIGEVMFRAAGPCSRCAIPTIDQITSERGKEPLRTLATYRRDPAAPQEVNFGQNLIQETKAGTLRVGDPVVVL